MQRYLFTRASIRPIPVQDGLIWATTMATHMMAPMPFFWYTPHWAGWKWAGHGVFHGDQGQDRGTG